MKLRNRKTGEYTHSDMNKLCKCGHRLGVHAAETVGGNRPCLNEDCGDGSECNCNVFKVQRSGKANLAMFKK